MKRGKDVLGRDQYSPCHDVEVSRLEMVVGQDEAISSGSVGVSERTRGILPEER